MLLVYNCPCPIQLRSPPTHHLSDPQWWNNLVKSPAPGWDGEVGKVSGEILSISWPDIMLYLLQMACLYLTEYSCAIYV